MQFFGFFQILERFAATPLLLLPPLRMTPCLTTTTTTRTLVTTWLAIIISGDFLYTIISQACKHPIGNEWENPSGLTLVLIVYRKIADR